MSGHAVVVWEYEHRASYWKAYSPAVTQHLERANVKQLTRVLLSDADPQLHNYYVNLRTLMQETEDSDIVVKVRRRCYPQTSPAGKGARWEVASTDANTEWHAFDMDIQCLIEEAWAKGDLTIDMSKTHLGFPYIINFTNLTQKWLTNGYLRNVRRIKQAPYPLIKVRLEEMSTVIGRRTAEVRKSARNYPHANGNTPSGKHQINNNNNASAAAAAAAVVIKDEKKAHSAPASEKKKSGSKGKNNDSINLAKAILHNLNIFGHKSHSSSNNNNNNHTPAPVANSVRRDAAFVLDVDSSSIKSGRRPSLDTVSTYLSQESRDSQATVSTADLLTCVPDTGGGGGGGGGVGGEAGCADIVGIDSASAIISKYVRVSNSSEWAPRQPCPSCRLPLKAPTIVVALPCNHVLHLDCLNYALTEQRQLRTHMHIQCNVCGCIFGEKHGNQPAGSMDWCILDRSLPGYQNFRTIEICYNIQSGIQSEEHPNPGREYYAVGFPRKAYIPDSAHGRKLLQLLQIAWHRRLIFTVSLSHTTGCEDVVVWNIPHKTEIGPTVNDTGYPDPNYMRTCFRELEALGIIEDHEEYERVMLGR